MAADGLSQEWTDTQIGMAVTRAQAKRNKQAERPLTVAPELDLKINGQEKNGRNNRKKDTTLTHGWKMANEKKPAKYTKMGWSKYHIEMGFPYRTQQRYSRNAVKQLLLVPQQHKREGHGHRS